MSSEPYVHNTFIHTYYYCSMFVDTLTHTQRTHKQASKREREM